MPKQKDDDLLIARAAIEAAAPHHPPGLTNRGAEHGLPLGSLIDFLGYGRLDAPLWFLGIEEGVCAGLNEHTDPAALERNLRVRGAHFDRVMDLRTAMRHLGHPHGAEASTMVWQRPAQIACALLRRVVESDPAWPDLPRAGEAKRWAGRWLGTREPLHPVDLAAETGREAVRTFLGEVRPLPMHHLKMEWELTPYRQLFGFQSRPSYQDAVAGYRSALWQEAASRAAPEFVIAHGKDVWEDVDRIFGAEGWELVSGMRNEAWTKRWGTDGATRIFKVHSFAMVFPTADIACLVGLMRAQIVGAWDDKPPLAPDQGPNISGVPRRRTGPAARRGEKGRGPMAESGWASEEGFQTRVLDVAAGELQGFRSARSRGVRPPRSGHHVTVSTGQKISYSVDAIKRTRTVKVSAFSNTEAVQRGLEDHLGPFLDTTVPRPAVVKARRGKRYVRFEWEAGTEAETKATIRRCLAWLDNHTAPLRRSR